MFEKILKFFKKEENQEYKVVNVNEVENESEKIIAKMNGILTLNALLRKSVNSKGLSVEQINKKFFPRTAEGVDRNTRISEYAMDDCDVGGKYNRMSGSVQPEIARFLANTDSFLGWTTCALLAQNWIVNRACSATGEDAVSAGYRLIGYDEDIFSVNFLREMYESSKNEFNIFDVLTRASFVRKLYGGSLVIPVIEGVDYEKPFNIKAIKKNSYKGMRVVEPYWYTYDFDTEDTTNPLSLGFYEPTYYNVNSSAGTQKIHRSWVISKSNARVGDILKPSYYYYGVSTAQMIYNRAYCFGRIANESPLLAMTKRLLVADADIENFVANPEYAEKMLDAVIQCRDNFGVLIKGQENQVAQIDTNLAGFDTLIQKEGEIVSAIAEQPLDKYVKTSSKNSNSGGLFQENEYKSVLRREQTLYLLPVIELHNKLWLKSKHDIEDNGVLAEFNPLDTPSAKEVEETNETISKTLSYYTSVGILNQEECRKRIRLDPKSGFAWLPKVNEQIINAELNKKNVNNEENGENPLDKGGMSGAFNAKSNLEGAKQEEKPRGISNAVKQ